MFKQIQSLIVLAALGLAVIATNTMTRGEDDDAPEVGPQAAADQVAASFEREQNREPGPVRRPSRESIDQDVLYRTMNTVHWTKGWETNQAVHGCDHVEARHADRSAGTRSVRSADALYPCVIADQAEHAARGATQDGGN